MSQIPEIDAVLDDIGSKVDLGEIAAASDSSAPESSIELAVEVPLYYRPEPMGVSNRLGGLEKGNPSTMTKLWDVENWYIQE